MLVYQPTFNNINIRQASNKYNVSAQKSKGIYISKLRPLHNLAPIITYYGHKITLRFSNITVT